MNCIIPAAGKSERMGMWKPVLPLGKSTIIQVAVKNALEAGLSVILVTGFRAKELEKIFLGIPGITLARNLSWKNGRLSSIKCAIKKNGLDSFICTNADMPFIKPSTFTAIKDLSIRRRDGGLPDLPLFPSYRGELGHPVYIPGNLVSQIKKLPNDMVLKKFLLDKGAIVLPVDDPGCQIDIDSMQDYNKFSKWDNS